MRMSQRSAISSIVRRATARSPVGLSSGPRRCRCATAAPSACASATCSAIASGCHRERRVVFATRDWTCRRDCDYGRHHELRRSCGRPWEACRAGGAGGSLLPDRCGLASSPVPPSVCTSTERDAGQRADQPACFLRHERDHHAGRRCRPQVDVDRRRPPRCARHGSSPISTRFIGDALAALHGSTIFSKQA